MQASRRNQRYILSMLMSAVFIFSLAPVAKSACDSGEPFGFSVDAVETLVRGNNITYTFWMDDSLSSYWDELQVTGSIPAGISFVSNTDPGAGEFYTGGDSFYWYTWGGGCQTLSVVLFVPEDYARSSLHNEFEVTDWNETYNYSVDTELTGGVVTDVRVDLASGGAVTGGKVKLPITLKNVPGLDVSGISTELYYDTNALEFPRGELGDAAYGKELQWNDFGSGHLRIGIIGLNADAIPDGVVAYLSFDVKEDFSGTTTIENWPAATDPEGEPVIPVGSFGTLTVNLLCGDCNNNGSVSIAEVQSVINMYLGISEPGGCADVSGNGFIEINEVQLTIVNFLNVAPASAVAAAEEANAALVARKASLYLGSAKGRPGQTVTVPINLKTNGSKVAATSTDITFDPELLGNPVAVLGPSGESAGKSVKCNLVSPGVFRVGVIGLNTSTMTDGVVANVSFTIKAKAKAGVAVLENTPSASQPSGAVLGVKAEKKKGFVNILKKRSNR